jgi:hypothetical protein
VNHDDRASMRQPDRIALLCAIAAIGLLGIAVATLSLLLGGGYHPETYPAGIDFVKAGMVWTFAWATVFMGVLAANAGALWLTSRDRGDLPEVIFWIGFTVGCLAAAAIFLVAPGPGPFAVPAPIATAFFFGLGLILAGAAPMILSAARDAVKRRDWRMLIGWLIVGGIILIGVLRRR